jgi:uncharacterized protein
MREQSIYTKETRGKGLGIFATRNFKKDEVITAFRGPRIKVENIDDIPDEVVDHLFNVGVDEYIVAFEPEVRTNHSCDPNAGIREERLLVAMRDIQKDEEVTFDYSMILADDWEMDCLCGSPICRKRIGKYANLPEEIKVKYRDYTPKWIQQVSE